MQRAEEALGRALGRQVRLSAGQFRDAALAPLLGPAEDVATLAFPHAAVSLTHAGGVALAVRVEDCAGVGVDYEPWRAVDLRTARFFLRASEQATLDGPLDLLRRWTVKEALFKATPRNAESVLTDYEIADPAADRGVVAGQRGERLHYACVDVGIGHVAVAVCERSTSGAH